MICLFPYDHNPKQSKISRTTTNCLVSRETRKGHLVNEIHSGEVAYFLVTSLVLCVTYSHKRLRTTQIKTQLPFPSLVAPRKRQ